MYYKYPRTPHFPWSPGRTRDDRVMNDPHKNFTGKMIVVTLKKDGENTTMYKDYIHARSIDSKDHESRHWVKSLHRNISYLIPTGWRICGENMYAKHSIHYTDLETYFYVYSIWNEKNMCLSYLDTVEKCAELDLLHIPIIYIGTWGYITKEVLQLLLRVNDKEDEEGYVVRLFDSFYYDDFETSVAKYVRENHVQTDEHWMHQEIIKNELKQ